MITSDGMWNVVESGYGFFTTYKVTPPSGRTVHVLRNEAREIGGFEVGDSLASLALAAIEVAHRRLGAQKLYAPNRLLKLSPWDDAA